MGNRKAEKPLAVDPSSEPGFFSDVLDAVNCAVVVADVRVASLPIVYVNTGFERLTGYAREDVLGRTVAFFHADPEDPAVWDALRHAAMEQQDIHIDLQCRRQDGSLFWSEAFFAPVRGQRTPGEYYVGHYADLTDQRQALVDLKSIQIFNSADSALIGLFALDAVISGVTIVDTQLAGQPVVYVNAAFERLTGYPAEDVIGQPCCFLYAHSPDQPALQDIQAALATHGEAHVELRGYRKDGSLFWSELTLSPVFDGDRRLTHYLAIHNDITERREAHRQLEALAADLARSRDELIQVLDQFPSGVLIVEAEGVLTFASTACQRVAGIDPSIALGQRWDRALPIDPAAALPIEQALAAPAAVNSPLSFTWQDTERRTRWVECTVRADPHTVSRRLMFLKDTTELHRLRETVEASRFGLFIGDSEPMHELYRLISDVAQGHWNVLIEGETGVGKELVARGVHDGSPRKDGPFIAVNCAGLSESLLTSQLFGHRKGAFTGALSDQEGLFEAASGGTLFLDEIGDLPLTMQASLLRVLQEKEITRVGETRPRKVDARIIAATHKDLASEAQAGRFRQDLLFRLRVARIPVPALRERKEDIPLLAQAFLTASSRSAGKSIVQFSVAARQMMEDYDWPGNVRELRACVDHAVIRCPERIIQPRHLPPELFRALSRPVPESNAIPPSQSLTGLHQPEQSRSIPPKGCDRTRVLAALNAAGGHRSRAAKLLGVSRATLYRWLATMEIPLKN
jgi:PAS domain S-box-containing protein